MNKGLQRRQPSDNNDTKTITNELFVSIVRYGKIVDNLYSEQLREKYGELYKQFLKLEEEINEEISKRKKS